MSQPLPYVESNFDKNVKSEDILKTPDTSDIGEVAEYDLKYRNGNKKQKTVHFLL